MTSSLPSPHTLSGYCLIYKGPASLLPDPQYEKRLLGPSFFFFLILIIVEIIGESQEVVGYHSEATCTLYSVSHNGNILP